MKYNKFQIHEIINGYFWMIKEVQRVSEEIEDIDSIVMNEFGVEAILPKQKGIVTKAVESEVVRNYSKLQRVYEYSNQINFINEQSKNITDEKEKVVLDCILDGMSITNISKHLGLSRTTVTEIRNNIVDILGGN